MEEVKNRHEGREDKATRVTFSVASLKWRQLNIGCFSSVYCFCYSLGIMHCHCILWCLNSEMCNSEHFKSIFWDILITFTMKLNTHLDLVLSVIHKKLKCRKCDHTDTSEILKLNNLWIHHKPRTYVCVFQVCEIN